MAVKWLWEPPGPVWQWVGLAVTFAGTALSLWAVVAARSARDHAKRAAESASRLGRTVRWNDLGADLQELVSTVAAADFGAIAAVASRLRGRIARLSAESYDDMSVEDRQRLTAVLGALTSVGDHAISRRGSDQTRLSRIRAAVGEITETLNFVIGGRVVVSVEDLTGD
ncbi:MAG TPA: hypothetical protein VF170_04595 [Planctomycetaceae bacterium]